MKIGKTITKIAAILSLVLILLIWPAMVLSTNYKLWILLQKEKVSLPQADIESYDKLIAYYLKGKITNLDFLTQKEILHLQDVRILIIKINMIFWFSLVVFSLACISLGKNVKNIIRKTCIFLLCFLVLFTVLTIVNFDWIFLKFHEIFFTSNYAFSHESILKILYPDIFFRNIFIVYILLSILGCSVVTAISYKFRK